LNGAVKTKERIQSNTYLFVTHNSQPFVGVTGISVVTLTVDLITVVEREVLISSLVADFSAGRFAFSKSSLFSSV
jgi:hypothetical protein